MTYKQAITSALTKLARDKRVVFIGYNTACGGQMYGTLKGVRKEQLLETPVAENLMVGLAMGMSLEGYRPVVCFERSNFLYASADAIRHHLCMLPHLSGNQFSFPVVLRVIAGHDKPLDPGIQHKWGDAAEFAKLCNLDMWSCESAEEVQWAYSTIGKRDNPIMIIEHKRLYDTKNAHDNQKVVAIGLGAMPTSSVGQQVRPRNPAVGVVVKRRGNVVLLKV